MALDDGQEQLEHTARIKLMGADAELNAAQKWEQDWRLVPQRVIIQAALATAVILGAAASVAGYYFGRSHG